MYYILALLFLVHGSHSRTYENHQVLRISLQQPHYNLQHVLDLAEEADVWSVNQEWVDVMVSPSQLSTFQNLTYNVHIDNVQSTIDEHTKENEAARLKANADFDFTFFPTTGEVRQWIAGQKARHPEAQIFFLGYTYLGNEIEGISFGRAGAPMIYLHCTIHAREWITTTSCLWIVDQLLNADPDRITLLNRYRWLIVPVFNIDGYDYTRTSDCLWRKNRQPNTGSTCIGTDLNRNYGYAWGGAGASTNPCTETYRGARAFSAPETTNEIKLLQPFLDQGNVRAYVDIHSYGGYLLSAWGYTNTQPRDYAEMNRNMVSSMTAIRSINGRTYTYGASGPTLYATSGSTVDHLYGEFGVTNSYTIECYGTSFTAPTSYILPIGKEVWAGIKQLALNL